MPGHLIFEGNGGLGRPRNQVIALQPNSILDSRSIQIQKVTIDVTSKFNKIYSSHSISISIGSSDVVTNIFLLITFIHLELKESTSLCSQPIKDDYGCY